MAYAPDLTVSAICRLFPCSGRRAPNWLERKLSHLVPSASSRNSLTNKITNAATRSEETEVRRPSAMIAAAGTHCAHRGRVEASPLSSSARPFARGSPLRCFCCWLHCCIPRSVLSLLEHPRRALSYATRILWRHLKPLISPAMIMMPLQCQPRCDRPSSPTRSTGERPA